MTSPTLAEQHGRPGILVAQRFHPFPETIEKPRRSTRQLYCHKANRNIFIALVPGASAVQPR